MAALATTAGQRGVSLVFAFVFIPDINLTSAPSSSPCRRRPRLPLCLSWPRTSTSRTRSGGVGGPGDDSRTTRGKFSFCFRFIPGLKPHLCALVLALQAAVPLTVVFVLAAAADEHE